MSPQLGVALKQGRTEWWLLVTVNGERISGDLWSRPTRAAAEAAAPALLEHWQLVSVDVYGSVAAGLTAAAEQYGVEL